MRPPLGPARWATLAVALLVLNASLTFHNVWPTLAVRLATPWEVSPELALALLALVAWATWRAPDRTALPRAAVFALAALSVLLVLARYAEVTAPALYGRPVNLYWDAPHVGNVVGMLAEVAGSGLTLLAAAGVLLAVALAFVVFRLAWSRIARALKQREERVALGALAGVAALAWGASLAGAPLASEHLRFALPVTATIAAQARLTAGALLAADRDTSPAAEPSRSAANPVDAFPALDGDDVLLVFLESYGAVTYSRPEFAARLEGPRDELDAAIAATGRQAVSATVTAPTFGGNSWLSHLTLLTGLEVADPDTYARTMQVPRTTLVQEFAAAGYATIALMPGLRQAWPEGAFYRFDAILGADALDYRGPEFGWWRIPDQYALAALERQPRDGRPRFVFFPTISSHAPFRPTPPYQPDWERLRGERPFGDEATAALAIAPDWTNLGPAYADTIAYAHAWLAGWLRRQEQANVTVVVLGDHQPPAAVSGPGADWTVPVHVVSRRDDVVQALLAAGFVRGLRPPAAPLLPMHRLRPVLSTAFAGPPPDAATRVAGTLQSASGPVERTAGRPDSASGSAKRVDAPRVHVAGGAGAPRVRELGP